MSRSRALSPDIRRLALVIGCVFFMEQLDTTILASALPVMARDLRVSSTSMNLALTSYLVSLCVFIPMSGWIAERFGTRTIFSGAIAIFGFGSVLCAIAASLPMLLLARGIQGLGGAMMLPVGRLTLLRVATRSERMRAMSVVLIPGMLGPVFGPAVGGLIISYVSWHWIFYVNVPVSLVGLIASQSIMPELKSPRDTGFDWFGATIFSLSLISLLGALELGRNTSDAFLACVALCSAIGLGCAYRAHALSHPAPLIDLTLLEIPTFGLSSAAGTLFRISFGSVPFLIPMLFQTSFGIGPLTSGILTSMGTIGGLLMKGIATPIIRVASFRLTLVWNGALCTVFLLGCASLTKTTPTIALGILMISGGLVRSLQFNAYGTITYADVVPQRLAAAASFYDMAQQFSQSIGVSFAALTLTASAGFGGRLTPQSPDFKNSFIAAALVGICAIPLCLRLPKHAGQSLLSHPGTQKADALPSMVKYRDEQS